MCDNFIVVFNDGSLEIYDAEHCINADPEYYEWLTSLNNVSKLITNDDLFFLCLTNDGNVLDYTQNFNLTKINSQILDIVCVRQNFEYILKAYTCVGTVIICFENMKTRKAPVILPSAL